MKILLIDDIRTSDYIRANYNLEVDTVAKSYSEGIEALKQGGWDKLLLDHDLNSFIDGVEKTGTDIMKFLQENTQYLPKEIVFVTMNPGGRSRMRAILRDIENNK